MPEYLAPGVYVEEVSFRAKSIEGVSTTTTGFVGPTRYGPVDIEPDIITSLGEFERVYGDRQMLKFDGLEPMHNYIWHGVRAFFENGGKRLYISRVFESISSSDDGYADAWLTSNGQRPVADADVRKTLQVRARCPGSMGAMRVRLTLSLSQNVLSEAPDPANPSQRRKSVNGLLPGDVVWISDVLNSGSPPGASSGPEVGDFYLAETSIDPTTRETIWHFSNPLAGVDGVPAGSPPSQVTLDDLNWNANPRLCDRIRIVTLAVTVLPGDDSDALPQTWANLPLDPNHTRAGQPDSLFDVFSARPASLSLARRLPVVIERGKAPKPGETVEGTDVGNGIQALQAILAVKSSLLSSLATPGSTDSSRSIELRLDGGNDGVRPSASSYEGTAPDDSPYRTGLKALEALEDISIIAAPGATFGYEGDYRDDAATINGLLISHAERMRYRIAVLDSGDGQAIADVRAMRAQLDSKYAALYYPWVKILDPVTRQEVAMPPSGFVAGIYARNDVQRAVYKAPANEIVTLALGFETMLSKAQQEVLNPEGINCFRFFEGRGMRLWGARTISSDPEWKYVNLRRYFAYLERSIDLGTQWAVFEPNGERLWANVRETIKDFLFNEWSNGALLGETADKAFFVRCDRSTMNQNDLDNGRLVCLIGVAPLKPAEFVIFRIGQWTADRKS
jgi:phage tail sheath protein FI